MMDFTVNVSADIDEIADKIVEKAIKTAKERINEILLATVQRKLNGIDYATMISKSVEERARYHIQWQIDRYMKDLVFRRTDASTEEVRAFYAGSVANQVRELTKGLDLLDPKSCVDEVIAQAGWDIAKRIKITPQRTKQLAEEIAKQIELSE